MPATGKHTGSLIFLHGSGDTGYGVMSWLNFLNKDKDFTFPHIRIVYPSAPERPFTPLEGEVMSVWFDRKLIDPHVPEDPSVDQAANLIHELVEQEVKNGIPRNRILLGGFSMGGALSLYYGLQRNSNLAGLFALSSFLNDDSKVFQRLQNRPQNLPPVLQIHGGRDVFIHHDWGKATCDKLRNLGVDITFHTIPDMPHELRPQVLDILRKWALKQVPEKS